MLATLAAGGMNCARLNMSHGDHEWHKTVIDRIRKLNKDNGYAHYTSQQLAKACPGVDIFMRYADTLLPL